MSGQAFSLGLVILLTTLFAGYLLYGLALLLISTTKEIRYRMVLRFQHQVKGHLKEEYEKYFFNFSFYAKLPDELKLKFILRVKGFIETKHFEGRDGLEVTEEMKALVAASAVQLTFGLQKYLLDHFDKIILYPDSYYSRLGDAYHMGETNPKGIIVLSWNDLVKGFAKDSDTFNVGLHEMAHALELEFLLKEDYDFYFGNYLAKWSHVAKVEYDNLQDEKESFFRGYAGTNRQEFFAVCVEYFFEASEEFKNRLPKIYYHLCLLLNQNPLARDTHVEEVKRAGFVTLKQEINSIVPEFITSFSVMGLSPRLLYVPAIILFMGFNDFRKLGLASIPMAVVFTIIAAATVYSLNKILVYENYLCVKNVWGKIISIYYLEDIISISFNDTREGDSMQVIMAGGGRIKKYSHRFISKSADIEILQQKLRQKNVLVK